MYWLQPCGAEEHSVQQLRIEGQQANPMVNTNSNLERFFPCTFTSVLYSLMPVYYPPPLNCRNE